MKKAKLFAGSTTEWRIICITGMSVKALRTAITGQSITTHTRNRKDELISILLGTDYVPPQPMPVPVTQTVTEEVAVVTAAEISVFADIPPAITGDTVLTGPPDAGHAAFVEFVAGLFD
jgi:hypothetical protein